MGHVYTVDPESNNINMCSLIGKALTPVALKMPLPISNGNRTEWSTIQGVIRRVISNQSNA